MADEYIRRVEAEEAIEEYCCRMCADYNQYAGGCVSHAQHCPHLSGEEILKPVETADVQPVKRGHWYHNTSKYISELDAYFIQACCSYCGRYSDRIDSYTATMSNECCSHCGADMRTE